MNLTKIIGKSKITIWAIAADGPSQGSYVEIGARYNTDLTAGSGTSSTPIDYGNYLLEDGTYNLLLENGTDNLAQQA
jgi:hypothetical protein